MLSQKQISLPIPDSERIAKSQSFVDMLKRQMNETGKKISFADYMELALYHEEFGYYQSEDPKFGRGGDFITAPEISPLFSQCIANQCIQIFERLKGKEILEIGAGNGKMCSAILIYLESIGQLPSQYFIYEKSKILSDVQKEHIKKECPHLQEKITWLDHLNEKRVSGIIIANEVMDAFPVHRFKYTEHGFKELYIDVKDNQLKSIWNSPTKEIQSIFQDLNKKYHFSNNYQSEINLAISRWLKQLYDVLDQGLVLLIDYGYVAREYYHPQRDRGTLQCFYQHHVHDDPLWLPGSQDITAHVDFTAVAEQAHTIGFNVRGFTNQASFLINCGMIDLAQKEQSLEEHYKQAQKIKQLTLPSEMGELVKVMGLTKSIDTQLLGFHINDMRQRL